MHTDSIEEAIETAYAKATEIWISGTSIPLEKARNEGLATLSLHTDIPFLQYKDAVRRPFVWASCPFQ